VLKIGAVRAGVGVAWTGVVWQASGSVASVAGQRAVRMLESDFFELIRLKKELEINSCPIILPLTVALFDRDQPEDVKSARLRGSARRIPDLCRSRRSEKTTVVKSRFRDRLKPTKRREKRSPLFSGPLSLRIESKTSSDRTSVTTIAEL
jgi:hypothetical protein